MTSSGETWYVKLANGDVHPVTLEQLDWAFEQGHIDVNTLVLPEEGKGWVRLGEAAGLDEELVETASPAPVAQTVAAAVTAPAPAPVVRPSPTPIVASYAPAPRAAAAVPSYAPAYAPVANSLRPFSMDTNDFDLNDVPFKKKSGKGWMVAVLSLAVMGGGVGIAATRAHGGDSSPAPQAAAVQAPPPAETHIPYQTPTPVATTTAPPGDSPLNPRFTQAQKDQLLKADKQHDEKAKSHASNGGGGAHPSGGKYKSLGFTTGGNKYDPLNSNL